MSIKFHSKEEENELILKNRKLVYYWVNKLNVSQSEVEDLVSIGTIGLIKAVKTFDENSKTKFGTYASQCIKNEIFMYFRKTNKYKQIDSLDEPVKSDLKNAENLTLGNIISSNDKNILEKKIDQESAIKSINIILNCLNQRERTVMLYRIAKYQHQNIANKLNISRSYVVKIKKSCIKKVKSYFDNNVNCNEVYSMSIQGEYYKISFSSYNIKCFNIIFANLLKNIKTLYNLPIFRIEYNKEKVEILVPAEPTNVKEIPLHKYFKDYNSAPDFKNDTAKIETTEKIIYAASLLYSDSSFTKELDDYDYATNFYMDLYLSTFKPGNAKITLPTPDGYDNTIVRIVVGGKTYSGKASNGLAVFENVPMIEFEEYMVIDGSIYFSKSLTGSTLATTSEAAVETTIKTEKELPAGAKLSVKEVEISKALKKAKKDLKKIFDISVLDENSEIIPISDNKMSITITLDEDLKGYNTYKVVYIKDGEIVEEMDATVKDGKLTFITDHLSEYGIVAYNSEDKDGTPKTGNNTILYVGLFAVIALGSIVIINKKH